MRSLTYKLGVTLLLIVVLSVGLTVVLVNINTAREFQQFLVGGNMMYTGSVATSLGQFYAQKQNWTGVQDYLSQLPVLDGDRVVVTNASGTVVGDSAREWVGRSARQLGLSGGSSIVASGKQVGELYIFSSMMGMMGRGMMGGSGMLAPALDTASRNFLDDVNRSLWITGIIAAAVALVAGFLLTRQIIHPVRALIDGAVQIARGNLGYRVKIKARDEIGELAQSFNAMADSLDRSEQARRRLIADVAHELRTPLTIIEGTVDGIIDGVFKPEPERLGTIKEQTAHLTRLVSDLRDLSLAESGQLKLELTSTDLADLVRRKVTQFEVKAREKDISMRLDTPADIPRVTIDPTRIEQVLANLLTNALRHTPAGGSISTALRPATVPERGVSKASLVISIADTGEGIAPENLAYIFERFYRVESSRARSEGGAGLGLAIVKQMVEAHHGKVWVESEPGKGATFYVALPLSRD
ncbi:MAG: ATP-binding protein [Dehalococcoidia bacterium]|nr:ATP-binding protein [Dehalococcoidia bacterium]